MIPELAMIFRANTNVVTAPPLRHNLLYPVAALLHLMQPLLLHPTLPSPKMVLRSDLHDGPRARDEVEKSKMGGVGKRDM